MNTKIDNEQPEALEDILPVVDAVLSTLDRRLPRHISREDLASAAKLALVQALNRFQGPSTEARAYCFTRVRGAVFDELRRLDPLSRRTRAQVSCVQKAAAQLEEALGREPNEHEVAKVVGMDGGKVRKLNNLAASTQLRSLDEASFDGSPIHQVADENTGCPDELAEEGDLISTLGEALSRLPDTQGYVLRRYHFDGATLEEIASELEISRERVRQLRVAAEKKLKGDVLVMALWQSLAA